LPTVTQLKPQKNNKRVNVYLDYKFAFGIDLDNLVKFGIKIEKNFTQEEIDKIVHQAEFQKTFDKILRFAMTRPRSTKEVHQWFRRKEVADSMHPKLIERLQKLDLLDDTKFVEWWVRQRTEFKKKGKIALIQELRQKGIDKSIIDEVLQESGIDEVKLAKETLEKYQYKWERYEGYEKKQKMTEFLLRRGFSWEIVRRTIEVADELNSPSD
jgi:regulatory protein